MRPGREISSAIRDGVNPILILRNGLKAKELNLCHELLRTAGYTLTEQTEETETWRITAENKEEE